MTSTTIANSSADASDVSVAEDKEFIVSFRVVGVYDVRVTRPADISQEDLLASITHIDMANGESETSWDDVKAAWRNNAVAAIYDAEFEELFCLADE